MLLLLSPAKSLDYDTPSSVEHPTTPPFIARSSALIELLRAKSPAQIAALMDLSEPLAALNVARYAAWRPRSTAKNSKPAVLAFNGDVYDGLDARTLGADDLAWAQQHVAILSGLYGVLRPLDRLQPYRLEMGTALANPHGKDLYAFWGDVVTDHLNTQLAKDASPVVVNLASQEYFRAVQRKRLKARVIDCVFEDWKGGGFKVISFFAKRARGSMARFAIQQRLRLPRGLQAFRADGYAFEAAASEPDRWVFRRRTEDA
jgi:uncharacterized protein